MSSHMALPREGHLQQLYHIFACLKKYHNSEMTFDPSIPWIDNELFHRQDWSSSGFDPEIWYGNKFLFYVFYLSVLGNTNPT